MPPQQIKGEIALWRNIVKKIFSLIIALTLLVSIFAVSAVAFADETRTVTVEKAGNEYMEECLIKKVPDIPPQIGMMYLPKANLHKLLRYGDLC